MENQPIFLSQYFVFVNTPPGREEKNALQRTDILKNFFNASRKPLANRREKEGTYWKVNCGSLDVALRCVQGLWASHSIDKGIETEMRAEPTRSLYLSQLYLIV